MAQLCQTRCRCNNVDLCMINRGGAGRWDVVVEEMNDKGDD